MHGSGDGLIWDTIPAIKKKLGGFSPQANYTEQATAAWS
jgi:hypothetical protein